MDQLRKLRTMAYERFGVFQARVLLVSRNVTLPSEQIVSIVLFLEHGLARMENLWFVYDRSEVVVSRLTEVFHKILDQFQDSLSSRLVPLENLALAVQPVLNCDLYGDFAELMHLAGEKAYARVGTRLQDSFRIGPGDIELLSEQFARTSLPRAVRRFDLVRGYGSESAWLETVFYRFAIKLILADQAAEQQLKAFRCHRVEAPPEAHLEAEFESDVLTTMSDILQTISLAERRAIALYFGITGSHEHTVAEVAEALGCSRYHARAAILMGLARLAAILGVQGSLEDDEFRLARLFFQEGLDLERAASELGWHTQQARRVLSDVQSKFASVLRRRTVSVSSSKGTPIVIEPSENTKMPEALLSDPTFQKSVHDALRNLREAPEIKAAGTEATSESDQVDQVYLDGKWVPLSTVQQMLLENEELLKELFNSGVPLEWLEYPHERAQREDLSTDHGELDATLEALARRPFNAARSIAHESLQQTGERNGIPEEELEEEQVNKQAENVLRVLGGVAQSIRSTMPRSLRRQGKAIFYIKQTETGPGGQDPVGRWPKSSEELDLYSLIYDEAQLVGDFDDEVAYRLARIIYKELADGESVLPGFKIIDHNQELISLEWSRPVVDSARTHDNESIA